MSHHTNPNQHTHTDEDRPHTQRGNTLVARGLISLSTVAIALVLHLATGLGPVPSVLAGFVATACLATLILLRRRSGPRRH